MAEVVRIADPAQPAGTTSLPSNIEAEAALLGALRLDNRLVEVLVSEEPQAFNLQIGGQAYAIETVRRRAGARREEADQFVDGRWVLRAPLTGVVTEARVAAGDIVAQGDVLMVVEAMKMLNELRARVPGRISAVNAEATEQDGLFGSVNSVSSLRSLSLDMLFSCVHSLKQQSAKTQRDAKARKEVLGESSRPFASSRLGEMP